MRGEVRVIVMGAAWYGDWAKNLYLAFKRLGYDTDIVYNNSLPAPMGGNKDSVTSFFERSKATVRRFSPGIFRLLKTVRQRWAEREILLRVGTGNLRKPTVVVFTWTPGSRWVLKKLREKAGVRLVLWLGEPTVRDASWEPTFDYFGEVFIVDDGKWVDILSEKNKKRAKLLPLASDNTIFYPLTDIPQQYRSDVVFVGKYLRTRAQSLAGLKERDLHIYGYGWEAGFAEFPWLKEKYRGGIATTELNAVYNGAKIALGTIGAPKDPFTTATMRTFDIALTATFQVAEEVYLTKKLFGDAIGFWKSNKDLKCLVDYYLEHGTERKEKGMRSRDVALHWTYAEDAKRIMTVLGYATS